MIRWNFRAHAALSPHSSLAVIDAVEWNSSRASTCSAVRPAPASRSSSKRSGCSRRPCVDGLVRTGERRRRRRISTRLRRFRLPRADSWCAARSPRRAAADRSQRRAGHRGRAAPPAPAGRAYVARAPGAARSAHTCAARRVRRSGDLSARVEVLWTTVRGLRERSRIADGRESRAPRLIAFQLGEIEGGAKAGEADDLAATRRCSRRPSACCGCAMRATRRSRQRRGGARRPGRCVERIGELAPYSQRPPRTSRRATARGQLEDLAFFLRRRRQDRCVAGAAAAGWRIALLCWSPERSKRRRCRTSSAGRGAGARRTLLPAWAAGRRSRKEMATATARAPAARELSRKRVPRPASSRRGAAAQELAWRRAGALRGAAEAQ